MERVGTSCRVPPVRGPGASQMVDQHPWGTTSHAAAIAFLPAFIGNLLGDDGIADPHDLVHESSVQALAVGGQLAFSRGFTPPTDLIAPALLPSGSAFAAFLWTALVIIVLGIGGPPLPLHLALQPADGFLIGTQLRAQCLEPGLRLLRHDGEALWSQVQADGVAAYGMLGLVMGHAFEHQLHKVALPLPVGTLSAWAGGLAPHQAGILDLVRQAVGDHRVIPIDARGNVVVVPQQVALRASLVLGLQHKAHARIAALVLDAAQPSAAALEAYASGFAQADTIEGTVGTGGQRLGQYGIQVLGQLRDPQRFRQFVKGILGKAVALPQGCKGSSPLLRLCAGDGAGRLPGRVVSHAAQALLSCGEHSVVELPPNLQVAAHACGLPGLHHQGQFEQKRRRLLSGGRALLRLLLAAHGPHLCLKVERLFQF